MFTFKIIIIFETQLPHHNIKNLNQFKLKTVCLLLYLPIVYLNYIKKKHKFKKKHKLILHFIQNCEALYNI